MAEVTRIAVIGAGSWGTALACHLARNGINTCLWGRDSAQMLAMEADRVNQRYLPDIPLPQSLQCVTDFDHCIEWCDVLLLVTPSYIFRDMLKKISSVKPTPPPLIWACKGLDKGTGSLLDSIAREVLGESTPLAVISGPTFAKELMAGLPTAITIASENEAFTEQIVHWLHSETFRVYRSADIAGVQLGGALKNVFAIAAGISDGLGYGANARAALITRGLAELMRLGVAMGGQRETFMGLAGMGDLVLTCTDNLSRNRRMGLALAKGLSVEQAQTEIGQSVEGVGAALETTRLAQQYNIEMPISEQVCAVLYHGKSTDAAVRDLLGRESRIEMV